MLPAGDQFRVLREGKPQGLHPSHARAMESAVFMATVEATRSLQTIEIFIADERGLLVQDRLIGAERPAVDSTAAGDLPLGDAQPA